MKRDRLMCLYGGSLSNIDSAIKSDGDYCMMYTGFKKFFVEEKLFEEG